MDHRERSVKEKCPQYYCLFDKLNYLCKGLRNKPYNHIGHKHEYHMKKDTYYAPAFRTLGVNMEDVICASGGLGNAGDYEDGGDPFLAS